MRLIVAPSTKDKQTIEPWIIEDLGAGYKLINIMEEEAFKQIEGEVEPDFEMQLGKKQVELVEGLTKEPIVFVTIGERQKSSKVSSYYEMTREVWDNKGMLMEQDPLWISCYSEDKVFASTFIKTIQAFIDKARSLKKTAVIYLDSTPRERYFSFRSLTYKIINELLEKEEHIVLQVMKKEDIAACYLMSEKRFEPYKNHFIYATSYHKLIGRTIKYLTNERRLMIKESLYNDVFYKQIPMTEKLYLPLIDDFKNKMSEPIDLNSVLLGKGIHAIYDTKMNIEKQSKYLKNYVMPQWTLPIVAQVPLHRINPPRAEENTTLEGTFKYRGENVYIGIVTVEGINWEDSLLRTSQGKTRIGCMWEQEQADKGLYYTAATINEALGTEKILSGSKSEATFLLDLAGGKQGVYEALASKAEFLIAKIKPATRNLQKIHVGEPHPLVALVPDVLIGACKLIELAKLNQKPLVLYLPYHYLLEGMEGVNQYDRIFDELSYQPGVTMIMPVGEEANKEHKQLIERNSFEALRIQTKGENQNLIGRICSEKMEVFQAVLQPLEDGKQIIHLEEEGRYQTAVGIVESSGLKWDYNSGQLVIRFRIEQEVQQTWQLFLNAEEDKLLKLSISLSEQEVNSGATLSSWTALSTVNPAPAKWSAIGVGNFDTKALVMRGGSGRTNHSNQAGLSCVAEGRANIQLNEKGEVLWLEGTAVAASLVTGAVATLYSKWQMEKGKSYPNTKMMQKWLEQQLTQLPEQTYPHFSQGDGILDLKKLEVTLMAPLE